jgi:DivIVA domain-containing protein
MPDQSSAASEHAILQEITAPLETLPDDPVAVVVNADFPSALRGYDRIAVDAYVQRTSQLVAELQATRSPEAAVRRALERVGEQISGILQRAHETAEEITGQSRAEAEDRLEAARAEAVEIIVAAQQRVKDLDADTDRIWIERGRIVDDARDLAAQLMSVAENASDRFPEVESEPHPIAGESEDEELEPPYTEHQNETELYDADHPGEANLSADEPDATVRYEPPADDVEATRRFAPLTDERAEPPPPEPPAGANAPPEGANPPPVRGTRSVIPPASQAAADRRASR